MSYNYKNLVELRNLCYKEGIYFLSSQEKDILKLYPHSNSLGLKGEGYNLFDDLWNKKASIVVYNYIIGEGGFVIGLSRICKKSSVSPKTLNKILENFRQLSLVQVSKYKKNVIIKLDNTYINQALSWGKINSK